MRVAIAQMNPTVGDLDSNYLNALQLAQGAAEQGADIVIFPANTLTGAPLEGLGASDSFLADAQEHLEILAANIPVVSIITNIAQIEDEDGDIAIVSELFILDEGEPHHLAYCVPSEEREIPFIQIGDESLAVLTEGCFPEDMEFPGATVFVEMAADAFGEDEYALCARGLSGRLQSLASINHAYVAYANMVGASDCMVFGGGSCAVSPDGDLIHSCSVIDQELLVFETTDMPRTIASESSYLMNSEELDWNALISATRDYVIKNRFTDVVIGLSGGIDSAVTATVAADALGASHVHGILMPSKYSSQGSIDDSLELANNLGIDTVTLPIAEAVEKFHGILGEACGGEVEGLAAENLQARIRTVYLMTVSNAKGWMVLNTGNKSEAAMGFSTLYGDTAGAYAPLGDLYKTRVYELARWRRAQSASIPENCITKAPSAELYPGATDQDRLPPYELLDEILQLHIEGGLGASELCAEGYDPQLVHEVLTTVKNNEYKRRNEPIAPHLGGVSLTEGRSWPITNGWIDCV